MSHHRLRDNKTCQNCSHYVSERFCTNCGQENTETRQPFHYLFKHFAEDLVHYDGKFWQTIKYLLFFPGKLTTEYLSGKRKSYVAPVKLYIFISFITFFIPVILPDINKKEDIEKIDEIVQIEKSNSGNNRHIDLQNTSISLFGLKDINSIKQLDSIQNSLPKEKQLSYIRYLSIKKIIQKKEDYQQLSKRELKEKISEAFTHNLPKVLFAYMPFFALSLWLFHNKKKWYYFDHGIFTLHYFSFILSVALLLIIFNWTLFSLFGNTNFAESISISSYTLIFLYSFFYFFRSHRRVYGEKKLISRVKGFLIFLINQFLMLIISLAYLLYIILKVH